MMSADGDPLVAFFLAEGYDLDRLRAEHADDGSGRCRACGGPQSGRFRWPCDTRRAADRAVERQRADRDTTS
ncbi:MULTISPECIES: hypothetical protein [Pseudonocardia]|uniref:hypothetical protein n=1 Tax=Pseudonocardia TaxID=1847 RepID=UPI000A285D5B|nr:MULTISPECIES: hypothetical protein [Pseudonocardia]